MTPDEQQQIRALAEAARQTDGVEPFSEATLLALGGNADADVDLSTSDENGALEAYAHVHTEDDGSSWAELAVHPNHRGRGLGAMFLGLVQDEHDDVRVWAHGDLPAARGLAQREGLVAVRDLWVMSRATDATPAITEPVLPEGFSARNFEPGDEESWLTVNARAFAHHPEQGRMTRADLDARMAEPWWEPAGLLFIIDDASGAVAASHWTKVAEPDSGVGEVYVVAVDPNYQGRGLGNAVTALGLAHLASRGLQTIELYVEGDNEPAIATYRRWGFTRTGRHVMYQRGR
ncbi:mycothiol synthase [Calidifontibacter terrae]